MPKHIVSFSGGKDSTCLLLMMLEKGMQVDEIIFCDTGMEFPQMYEHIERVEKYIGRKVTRLKNPKGFMYYFKDHIITRGKREGVKGKGWPGPTARWCTGRLKIEVIDKYLKSLGMQYTQFIGIAADESHRCKNDGKRYPLVEWGITELQALQYCYDRGFDWGGLYKQFRRVSCWCCPLQPLRSLYTLYINYPDLWQRLLEMDKYSRQSFYSDYTLQQLDRRFEIQSKQLKFDDCKKTVEVGG